MKPLDVPRAIDRFRLTARTWQVAAVSASVACGLLFAESLLGSKSESKETIKPPKLVGAQHNRPGSSHRGSAVPNPLLISVSRHNRISRFIENVNDSCLLVGTIDTSTRMRAALSNLQEIVTRSPLGASLLRGAENRRVLVCFDGSTDLMAYYRAGVRLIGLKPSLKTGNLVAYFAHELSHVPQHSIYSDNRYFSAADLILLRRVREAAAEAISTRVTWQLKQNGYASAWDLKRQDPFYGDIVRAFQREISLGPSPARELEATKRAFDAWFMRPTRLDLYDQMTIAHLDRISGDTIGLVPPRRRLTHRFLVGLTQMGNARFVTTSANLSLTDPFYSGNVSLKNKSRLIEILQSAERPEEAGADGTSDAAIGSQGTTAPLP